MPEILQRSTRLPAPLLIERRFYLLFLWLLAYLVLYPYTQGSGFEYVAFRIFGIVATLLAVYAVSYRRVFALGALVLAAPVLMQRLAFTQMDATFFSLLGTAFSFAFDVFVIVIIFRRVFAEERVDSEAVFGALCIYLLVGFSFAGVYKMLDTVQVRAFYFDPLFNIRKIPDRFDFIYYSFCTITSLGSAGIGPLSDQARSTTVIESIIGILYLAVLISKLMNTYHLHAISSRSGTAETDVL